jgi:hypothetical protein
VNVLRDLECAFVAESLGAGLQIGTGAFRIQACWRFVDVGGVDHGGSKIGGWCAR